MTTPISTAIPSILQTQKTNLRYLLNIIKDEIKREINCHAIGTIKTFDSTTLTCTVSINYQKVLKQSSYTAPNPTAYIDPIINYPILVRVPIVVMGGGGSYTTYPISPGDNCLVLFCDRDIDLWLELGGVNNPPNTERMHDLSDAVAIVGLYPTGANASPPQPPIANYNTKTISIVDQTGNRLWLPGMGGPYFGATLPSGFLWCDGSTYSTSLYPFLFAAIGYTYGGSGSNFKVPQMAGQVAAGIGGTLGLTLGQEFGEVNHTLDINEMPSHSHNIRYGSGTAGGGELIPSRDANNTFLSNTDTDNTGGGAAHNNVQPSLGVNWIIKI